MSESTKLNKSGVDRVVITCLNGGLKKADNFISHQEMLKMIGMERKDGSWNVPYHNHIAEIQKGLKRGKMTLLNIHNKGYKLAPWSERKKRKIPNRKKDKRVKQQTMKLDVPSVVIRREKTKQKTYALTELVGKTVMIGMFGNVPMAIDTQTNQAYMLS